MGLWHEDAHLLLTVEIDFNRLQEFILLPVVEILYFLGETTHVLHYYGQLEDAITGAA